MNAILTAMLVVPVLVSGYAFLIMATLTGATILAWDGAHLFLNHDVSPRVVHQRQYVTGIARALAWLVGIPLIGFGITAGLVMAALVAVGAV